MKKLFVAVACSATLLFSMLPLAACGGKTPSADAETALPDEDAPVFPGEEVFPDEAPPAAEETPPAEPADPAPPEKNKANYILIRTDGLNVRTGAGAGYASLGQVHSGEMLEYVAAADGWYRTRYRNRTAYVSAKTAYTALAQLDAADDAVERVIGEGLALLGTPYVYGAVRYHDGKGNRLKNFTTDAFDCSSLMQYIFYRGAGVLLDVTTRTQVKQGTPVAWNDIERGDLLFYTNAQRYNKTGVERIGHVALYLGDNYILHTASDFARIEQMSPTRIRYFVAARRIL